MSGIVSTNIYKYLEPFSAVPDKVYLTNYVIQKLTYYGSGDRAPRVEAGRTAREGQVPLVPLGYNTIKKQLFKYIAVIST